MKSMTSSELEESIKKYEEKLIGFYDIRINKSENILSGKGLYCANHFHYFDPTFLMYSIAKSKKVLAHQMAKPILFRRPIISKELKKHKAIMTPRPIKGEKLNRVDYARMKREISDYLDMDEPISFAYAGTRTKSYNLNEENRDNEKEAAQTGMLTLTKEHKGLKIVPVAIDTYQKNTKKVYVKALMAKFGFFQLFSLKQKVGVDISFGEPIDIDEYLGTINPETGKKHRKNDLMRKVAQEIYNMRVQHFNMNKGDPIRSLSKYY